MNKLTNKLSAFAVSIIMGAIIISFVLTGFNGINNNAGQVAKVGDSSITIDEFNRALQINIDRYTQMFKGKSLSTQQIKQFRIKETTLQSLIAQKHMLNFANDLHFDAGKKYIKNEIKEYKMFQTAGQFNIERYKQLLSANNLTPGIFEEQIIDQIKSKKFEQIATSIQDSKAATLEITKIKNKKMKAMVISFDKEEMAKNIKVNIEEINNFLGDEKNKNLLESLYKTYQADFKTKFPKKEAQGLKSVQKELAIKHLQKVNRKALTEFNDMLINELKEALANDDTKRIQKLTSKYGLTFEKEYDISLFDLDYKGNKLSQEQIFPLFKDSNTKSVIDASSPITVTILKPILYSNKTIEGIEIDKEIELSAQKNARMLQEEVLKHQEATTTVKTSTNLL